MDIRHQKILAAIVKEYSEAANPVGSKEIVERYGLKVSSATIRNDMAELEAQGYIMQPHKSAGRVPTDKGYRFFINELMRRFELSEKERKILRDEVHKLKLVHEQLGRSISHLLAQVSGQAAFALLPNEASATGLSKIIGEPELSDPKIVKDVTELFENIDSYSSRLVKKSEVTAEAFIGGESPIPVPKNLSLVVQNVQFKGGKKGVIGIVGPKRMSYAKNLSLLEYLSKLISGAAVIILIIKM
ncbi:MAG: DeoR family transcriptional regulator [Candidatus Doudnabacteria bacterium]|nr:DeoR family transcriptional regulator [Candidatus Doudnabacteria bacterium]